MFPASHKLLAACLAALGTSASVSQTTSISVPSAPSVAPPLDQQPGGGNLTGTPSALPADSAAFNPASDEGALTVLGASINGRELRGETIVAVRDGKTLIQADDLKRWRLRFTTTPVMIDGQAFVLLTSVPGLQFRIDKEHQQLQLTIPVEAFETTALSGENRVVAPSEGARTAFVNYDATISRASGTVVAEAFLEAGVSDERGLVANTMAVGNSPFSHHVIRLDTYALHDDPSGLTRLTIGDTLTHIATWEQPVRFGGIKWGTDFSLQPGFMTFPSPTFNGQAQLPSAVQLYVNNVLNYQGQVDQGPFSLNRLPVVSGAGDVSVVVRDILGVEHRIRSNYYVSTALLRPGLSDFSIEAGAQRENYGRQSFDYGQAFVAGSFRHGLTQNLTLETRAEVAADVQDIGGGFTAVLGQLGEIGAAGSVSRQHGSSGYLYRVYMTRISRYWSLSASYQHSSVDYMQLGFNRNLQRTRDILQVSGGANSPRWGSLTASISYFRLADDTSSRVVSLAYGRQLGRLGYLNLFGLRSSSNGGHSNVTAGASLAMSFGVRRTAFLQADSDNRRIEVQQNLPDDKGWGYRLLANQGESDQQLAELDYRGQAVDLTGVFSRFEGKMAERFQASGALILSGSSLLPSRRLDSSFAIVNVGTGEKGVRVYQDNRQVTTTNGAGIAIVTNLRPYEANRISVAPDDLKLEATIDKDSLVVVPRYLSGAKANFRVINGHAGTLLVQLPGGEWLEPGTLLTLANGSGAFYSGFDGEVFIDDIVEGKVLIAKRTAGACTITVPAVPKGIELPRIGPLICRPVEPAK